jgi:hypothetical protein
VLQLMSLCGRYSSQSTLVSAAHEVRMHLIHFGSQGTSEKGWYIVGHLQRTYVSLILVFQPVLFCRAFLVM